MRNKNRVAKHRHGAVEEFTSPYSNDCKVKIRRARHPLSRFDEFTETQIRRQREMMILKYETVARLKKDGVEIEPGKVVDIDVSEVKLAEMDDEYGKRFRKFMTEITDTGEKLDYAVSLIAGWSGDGFDKLPDNGRFTEEDVKEAFFSDEDDAGECVPRFQNAKTLDFLSEDDPEFPIALEIVDKYENLLASGKEEIDQKRSDDIKALGKGEMKTFVEDIKAANADGSNNPIVSITKECTEAKQALEDRLWDEMEAELLEAGVAQSKYGGEIFRTAYIQWIMDTANELERKYSKVLGFLPRS